MSGLCGEDGNGACGGEEEGLGGVAGGIWFEELRVRGFELCALNRHLRCVGLPLAVVFVSVDKIPDSAFRLELILQGWGNAHHCNLVLPPDHDRHPRYLRLNVIISSELRAGPCLWVPLHTGSSSYALGLL